MIGVLSTPGVWAASAENERSEAGGRLDRMVETVLSIVGLASDGDSPAQGPAPEPAGAANDEEGDVGAGIDPYG